jgi:two-component system response regulator AtoC
MARILVVDDEEGIRDFVAEALEGDGHTAVRARDGEEAAAKIRAEGFDLMITDLRMPGLDGMELVRLARSEQPEMEVIVLTAHGSVETAVEAMKLGALDYLQKPISSPGELRLLASRALERRSLLALRDRSSREAPGVPRLSYGDPTMQPVVEAIEKVARTNATVLLLGESGTGKEVAARTIHARSARASGPFVAVSCAAIAEGLLESELFGHEKGAFTGAAAMRRGRIELAEGGTLFLDEVGELKLDLQSKLLRVLQDRRFERVGGSRTMEADVRWIAATNRDLSRMLAAGRFREDLYHRLAVFPVTLPPLRERRSDVLPLAETLLERIGRELGRPGLRLGADARRAVAEGSWPGNVRELANALERAAILADGKELRAADLGTPAPPPSKGDRGSLSRVEREAIARALAEVGGNRKKAAARLGIGLRTLYEKLKRYGLS